MDHILFDGRRSATLAGLVMVAISVNVQKIIVHRHLPARGAAAVGALILMLALSLAALIPQPEAAYATEVGLAAVLGWIAHIRVARVVFREHKALGRPLYERYMGFGFGLAQTLPLSIGAVLLGLGFMSGLYWIAGTVMAAFVAATINAWVLLVEILR